MRKGCYVGAFAAACLAAAVAAHGQDAPGNGRPEYGGPPKRELDPPAIAIQKVLRRSGHNYDALRIAIMAQGWSPVRSAHCVDALRNAPKSEICNPRIDLASESCVCRARPELEDCAEGGRCTMDFSNAGSAWTLELGTFAFYRFTG